MFWPRAFDEHCDMSGFELGDDLSESLSAGGVEHLKFRQAQDDHLDIGDRGELGEEPLGGAEEKRAVESIDEDVVVEQLLFVVEVESVVDRFRGG